MNNHIDIFGTNHPDYWHPSSLDDFDREIPSFGSFIVNMIDSIDGLPGDLGFTKLNGLHTARVCRPDPRIELYFDNPYILIGDVGTGQITIQNIEQVFKHEVILFDQIVSKDYRFDCSCGHQYTVGCYYPYDGYYSAFDWVISSFEEFKAEARLYDTFEYDLAAQDNGADYPPFLPWDMATYDAMVIFGLNGDPMIMVGDKKQLILCLDNVQHIYKCDTLDGVYYRFVRVTGQSVVIRCVC